MRPRARGPALAALALLLAAGCAGPVQHRAATAGDGAGQPAGETATRPAGDSTAPAAAARPSATALPPAVDRVRTTDKVVFLTYDDGAERDPRLIGLVRERRLPVSFFLTDSVVGPGYAHFARLRAVGAGLQNHTLDHTALRGLPYAGQRAQICGQQRKLTSRFGVRPRLFRPPYGTYDATTLRAAADCGITALVLWRVSLDGDGVLTYAQGAKQLMPGDIVSVPSVDLPSLTLAERTRRLLKEADRRGLRVARLEDYLAGTGAEP
ncbi:polysaccharide deacetylase family protein [Streptomyces composti]|uniref:polysaccharide deacetylase family protein n=1 Tax=Streptomyces composti TaxID=2720025 RepID=UPI0028109EC8|nr:polysaccharide deacetylase family protein [Streptomyces composti]